jgi:hypothetical protein
MIPAMEMNNAKTQAKIGLRMKSCAIIDYSGAFAGS